MSIAPKSGPKIDPASMDLIAGPSFEGLDGRPLGTCSVDLWASEDGTVTTLRRGDTMVFPRGWTGEWAMREPLRKIAGSTTGVPRKLPASRRGVFRPVS